MGWVGVPHPRSWLSTLARGYLPWLGGYLPCLGGTYLGQEGTSSIVSTYSEGFDPLTQGTYPSLPIYLDQGGTYPGWGDMSLNEGTTHSVGNP